MLSPIFCNAYDSAVSCTRIGDAYVWVVLSNVIGSIGTNRSEEISRSDLEKQSCVILRHRFRARRSSTWADSRPTAPLLELHFIANNNKMWIWNSSLCDPSWISFSELISNNLTCTLLRRKLISFSQTDVTCQTSCQMHRRITRSPAAAEIARDADKPTA